MTKGIGYGPNRNREPDNRTVRWGKYRGKRMRDVPKSYLEWFVANAYPHMVARRKWAIDELARRRNKFNQAVKEQNMKDNVICTSCGEHNLVELGAEMCPDCRMVGTLSWLPGEPQEVEA